MPGGLIVFTLILFGAASSAALWRHGYGWGIMEPPYNCGDFDAIAIWIAWLCSTLRSSAVTPEGPLGG